MAHRIFNNMMAWKGQQPWHGLGVEVQAGATGEEMLKAAKLDWKVQRRALAMRDGNGGNLLVAPLAGFKAIVRQDTDQVFQVATDRYHPLQNDQIVNFFRDYCEAGHATMETVGAIDGGAKIWALAKLNGRTVDQIGEGDKVEGYMLLASSHDGSLRTIGKATQTRVVCWNTLSCAIGEKTASEFRMKHTRKWTPEVAKEAQKVMGMAVEQIQETNFIAKELASHSIDQAGRYEFVKRLVGGESLLEQVVSESEPTAFSFDAVLDRTNRARVGQPDDLGRLGKAILEAIINSPGANLPSAHNTFWGAVNGVTYHVDHERGRNQDSRLSAAWFGDGNKLKTDAVKVAMEMTGIQLN